MQSEDKAGQNDKRARRPAMRILAKFVAMIVVWILVAVVTGEVLCRMTGLGSWIVYTKGLYQAARNPKLATEFTPGFDGRSYGTRVKINRLGFRGEEVESTPSNGTFRIACVGDSFTFGMGVDGFDAWPAALAKRLLPPPGFDRVEVINAGVPGYNLQQVVESIRTKIRSLAPHVIVVGLVGNDLEPAFEVVDGYLCVPRKVHALPIPGKRWFQTHSYFYQFMAFKYGQMVARAVGEERMQTPRDSALQRQMKTAAQDNVTSLTVLIDELRSVGIPVVFANLGIPAESPLAGIGKDAGASSVSVPLDLKEIIPDGHPDKRGHARIAEQVADVLAGSTPVQGPPIPAKALCRRR